MQMVRFRTLSRNSVPRVCLISEPGKICVKRVFSETNKLYILKLVLFFNFSFVTDSKLTISGVKKWPLLAPFL